MRKQIAAANWKMNLSVSEAATLFDQLISTEHNLSAHQEAIFAVPAIYISLATQKLTGKNNVYVAAQNCHPKSNGAYTGEISAPMFASVGVKHIVIGHSERREYFNESDALLADKVNAVLENGLNPIFCIGETLQERESGKFFELLKNQLQKGVFHLSADAFSAVVLAYEPVWAIGTGLTASPAQAQEVHAFIRSLLVEQYGTAVAQSTSILYGGSCNPKNAAELFSQADIDGGLIGGASLKSRDFVDIVKAFNA